MLNQKRENLKKHFFKKNIKMRKYYLSNKLQFIFVKSKNIYNVLKKGNN